MENQNKFIFPILSLFIIISRLAGTTQVVRGLSYHHHQFENHENSNVGLFKLFVFGDSYADTGNTIKISSAWNIPYGITFPGKPSGRFSDGHVLTDYLASFLKIKSPIPYNIWRKIGTNVTEYGMNFAQGGTGVFDTLLPGPNLTTQIHFLQQVLRNGVYSKWDLDNSIALVSIAGNDYGTYFYNNGSAQGLAAFTTSLVNQLALDLKRIHELGVRKVAVTGLAPLGCLPRRTAMSWYQTCNETLNAAPKFHNFLLGEAVAKLNNYINDTPFEILDIYSAFMSVFNSQGDRPGTMKFKRPLKPCCAGVSSEYNCGFVDANGTKRYTVCKDPKSAFFWDTVHPSHEGWRQVFMVLQASILFE